VYGSHDCDTARTSKRRPPKARSLPEWLATRGRALLPPRTSPRLHDGAGLHGSIKPIRSSWLRSSASSTRRQHEHGQDTRRRREPRRIYPIVADPDFSVQGLLSCRPTFGERGDRRRRPTRRSGNGSSSAATIRSSFVLIEPMDYGRNFDRCCAYRLAAADREPKVATPVQWQPGDDVIIARLGRR